MATNITLNVTSVSTDASPAPAPEIHVDDAIRSLAKKRFEKEEKEKLKAQAALNKQDKNLSDEFQQKLLDEQVRIRVQEEQIRRLAEKAILEAELKKAEIAREAAIAAEIERLRNRTKQEILEDTVEELKQQLAAVKAKKCESCPHC